MKVFWFFLLVVLVPRISGQKSKPAPKPEVDRTQREVFAELLNDQSYDINEWPHEHLGRRTDVSVQLFINSFGSLNAANMDYSLDTFLRQRWRDPRLVHNSTKRSVTITDKSMQDRIWKPDTFFENVKEASLHMVTMPNILLRIYRNGDVLYSMRVRMRLACYLQLQQYPLDSQLCHVAMASLTKKSNNETSNYELLSYLTVAKISNEVSTKLSCYMDFNKYPLDYQRCACRIASYANTVDVIKYHWDKELPVEIPESLEISQFDILGHSSEEKTYHYVTGNFSGLHAIFSLRRQNGYHVLQTYIPTILIVSISWVSFWLDPNAVPGRVTLGVTTLLTLTTLASGIRQQLPPVSYVKAIDVWIGMCMIMVFGALLEFTFVNWLANRKIPPGTTPCRIPKCLTVCSLGADADEEKYTEVPSKDNVEGAAPTPKPPSTYINHARALDRLSRAFFPSFFLCFNLAYWPYYLTQQYNNPI